MTVRLGRLAAGYALGFVAALEVLVAWRTLLMVRHVLRVSDRFVRRVLTRGW